MYTMFVLTEAHQIEAQLNEGKKEALKQLALTPHQAQSKI
jgi:hypothetical protein